MEKLPEWQDIATAPEWGPYLVFALSDDAKEDPKVKPRCYVLENNLWDGEGGAKRFLIADYFGEQYGTATHWQPLPEEPLDGGA